MSAMAASSSNSFLVCFFSWRALASREVLITAPSGALRRGMALRPTGIAVRTPGCADDERFAAAQDGNSFMPLRRGDRLRDSLIAAAASFSNFVRSSALALAISSSRLRFSASASEMCFCRPRYAILLFDDYLVSCSLSCSSDFCIIRRSISSFSWLSLAFCAIIWALARSNDV